MQMEASSAQNRLWMTAIFMVVMLVGNSLLTRYFSHSLVAPLQKLSDSLSTSSEMVSSTANSIASSSSKLLEATVPKHRQFVERWI